MFSTYYMQDTMGDEKGVVLIIKTLSEPDCGRPKQFESYKGQYS